MSMRAQINAMTDEENRNLMNMVERIKTYVNSALSDSQTSPRNPQQPCAIERWGTFV